MGKGVPSLNPDGPCVRRRPKTDPECLRVCGDGDGTVERPFQDHDYEVASSCCCCPKDYVCYDYDQI